MDSFFDIDHLEFAYDTKPVLKGLSLHAGHGSTVALLGPNGSGKTTLFRIIAGLLPPGNGQVTVHGMTLRNNARQIREQLGIVFQSPSLDDKLSVAENLHHHGHLYGLYGRPLQARIDELLARLELTERRSWRVGKLSGGLKRQVELARCLLHKPRSLLLDEPTNGLDPAARRRFWTLLGELAAETGMSTLYTTHWFEEAELAATVGILHHGDLVAWDSPNSLKAELGGEVIYLNCQFPSKLAAEVQTRYQVKGQVLGEALRIVVPPGEHLAARLMTDFGERVNSITAGKPTLEDVFVARTGQRFEEEDDR